MSEHVRIRTSSMIRLDHVSKCYGLKHGIAWRLSWHSRGRRFHWALRDICLEIPQGDSLALVGINGCGKTTLLKIMSNVTRPTRGVVSVSGRISGLIDLGAGFHPDLTGMENIFLNGALLGMSRRQVLGKLDEVIDFAELGQFIHTPVRHYSWGMFLRLGFSIAIAADPEILIVDEALAVGDGYFQWKCLRKIERLKKAGCTLVFVSHLPNMAESVCRRAAWIHDGVVRADGDSSVVVAQYISHVHDQMGERGPLNFSHEISAIVPDARVGTGELVINSARLLDASGGRRHAFQSHEPIIIDINLTAHKTINDVSIGFCIEKPGQPVTIVHSAERGRVFAFQPGNHNVRIRIPQPRLRGGNYYLSLSFNSRGDLFHVYDCHLKRHTFTVTESGQSAYSERFMDLPCDVSWENLA